MKKIKCGIVGCGEHAFRAHVVHLINSKALELVAISDVSDVVMDKFEEKCNRNFKKCATLTDLLKQEVDAVFIATPDIYHAAMVTEAIEAGKHIFVEKPVATTERELKLVYEKIKEAERKGLIVSSCHPRRFDPPFLWIKDNLPKYIGVLGPVVSFSFDFSYHRPWDKDKHGGSLLLDHGNHEIDLLHFLFGYSGFWACKLRDTHDRYHVSGFRNDEIAFSFSGTRYLGASNYNEYATIRFEKGEMSLAASHDNGRVFVRSHEDNNSQTLYAGATDYVRRFKDTTENFGQAILGESENYLSLKDLLVNTTFSVSLKEKSVLNYRFS